MLGCQKLDENTRLVSTSWHQKYTKNEKKKKADVILIASFLMCKKYKCYYNSNYFSNKGSKSTVLYFEYRIWFS